MNGARTIFRRKGYMLTALAAAVLLAASSGTAWAQVTLDKVTISASPARVAEGGTLTVTVTGTATVPAKVDDTGGAANDTPDEIEAGTADDRAADRSERTAEVTLQLNEVAGITSVSTMGDLDDEGQVADANIVTNPQVRLVFGENTGTSERVRTATATVTVQINDDPDAENEALSVGLARDDSGAVESDAITLNEETDNVPAVAGVADAKFTIIDSDTQTYVLELADTHDRTKPPIENGVINATITAKPPHYQGGALLALHVRQDGERASGYLAAGEDNPDDAPTVAIGTTMENGNPNIEVNSEGELIRPADNSRDIAITQEFNNGDNGDGNRVTDTITLSAYAGTAGSGTPAAEPLDIDVLDLHGLPASEAITAVAKDMDGMDVMEIMEGGDPVYLTVTVDRGTGASATTSEQLTVNIRPADGQVADYDLSLARVVLEEQSSGKQSNDRDDMMKLSARPDEDVGAETLTLNLEVSGEPKKGTETSTGTFSIGIVDDTEKKIEPKATEADYDAIKAAIADAAGDEGLNPTESFMLTTSGLFDVMDGYTASYGVSVEGDSVSVSASSETITVNAVKAGESVIVVTGTARMSSSSLEPSQTVSDVASLKFPVMVVDKDLVVTLEMPDNVMEGNIVEGMSYEIGVMANRMITEAEGSVEVMIMRDRANSDADEDDFTVSSATIMAGYDSATAELMVTEDMMPDGGTDDNMGETLVLYGMAGDMETNPLTFTIWDQAVPTLPLIGQLLLAMFLMLGGARLYRRRQG